MRFLGINDFLAIARMTLKEYQLRMKAFQLKQLDKEFEIHQLAWQMNQAGAQGKNGKPYYKRFKDFFDYEEQERKILGTREQDSVLKNTDFSNLLKKSNKKGG